MAVTRRYVYVNHTACLPREVNSYLNESSVFVCTLSSLAAVHYAFRLTGALFVLTIVMRVF
jgi:hypothetical protein